MYAKEDMGRMVKWFFGLPLIFVIYIALSLAMPRYAETQRVRIVLNILSYTLFIAVSYLVVKYFLKYPFSKLLNEEKSFNYKNLFLGFVPMFIMGAGTNFIWMAFEKENFTYSLQKLWPLDFALAFVLVTLAAFLEELLCRAYIAHFVNDDMEKRKKQGLIYILVSAFVFAIAHFQNPEVAGSGAIYSMVFYFIMGAALMTITLRTRGIEAALGIHIANNLVNAWLFTYEGAALITNAVFTQKNNIGPVMLIQSVLCVVVSMAVVIIASRKKENV